MPFSDSINEDGILYVPFKDVTKHLKSLPSAQPEYEPIKLEDFAKTMSENTLYGFMAWHGEAFTLIKEMGFEICKKTM